MLALQSRMSMGTVRSRMSRLACASAISIARRTRCRATEPIAQEKNARPCTWRRSQRRRAVGLRDRAAIVDGGTTTISTRGGSVTEKSRLCARARIARSNPRHRLGSRRPLLQRPSTIAEAWRGARSRASGSVAIGALGAKRPLPRLRRRRRDSRRFGSGHGRGAGRSDGGSPRADARVVVLRAQCGIGQRLVGLGQLRGARRAPSPGTPRRGASTLSGW